MLAALITTVLFSISAVSANRTAMLLGSTAANFWRLLLAAALLALWVHRFGGTPYGAAFPMFLVSGLIGFGIGDLALFQALPRLGSRLTIMLVHCLAAPFAAATEWLWLGTTLSLKQMLCGLTILVGVSIAIAPGRQMQLTPRALWTGTLYGILAAFGQGFGAVISRKAFAIAQAAGQDTDGITAAYQRILGGLAVAAFWFWLVKSRQRRVQEGQEAKSSEESSLPSAEAWRKAWPWVIVNSLSGPTVGVSCYQWALKTIPTGVVLPIVATTPLVVIPFAVLMEGERPNVRSVTGGIIAVIGAVGLTIVST